MTFQTPEFGNPAGLPLYSGKVIVSGSNNESLAIPYMGKKLPTPGVLGLITHLTA